MSEVEEHNRVFDRNRQHRIAQMFAVLIAGVLLLNLFACSDRLETRPSNTTPSESRRASVQRAATIAEVSPPEVIQQLRQALEDRQPQVTILNPQPDEILQENTVNVRFQVQDLPIFKNQELNLGPHLNVILDNEPYINIYNLNEPFVLSNLAPGTHTLRVFAAYPWEESFKNEGAYAQTTFHIFAKNQSNNPAREKPLLTYNTPQGSYSSQPVLLDFFLSNAPLHLVAQEDPQDDITDWRIRCTINGESFIIDRWQPLYLQGFKPGINWIQLEFLDEQGNSISNVFNNTIRVVTYEPTETDVLSRLIGGQLSATQARGIVDPNTVQLPDVTPTTEIELPVESVPASEHDAELSAPEQTTPSDRNLETESDSIDQQPSKDFNRFEQELEVTPPKATVPEALELPAPIEPVPSVEPEIETAPETLEPNEVQEVAPLVKRKSGGFFDRFRRPTLQRSPETLIPEIIETPTTEPELPESELTVPPESAPVQESPEEASESNLEEIAPRSDDIQKTTK